VHPVVRAQRAVRVAAPLPEEINLLARTQAAEEWRRRVIAEYRSASVTHSLVGWLLQLGASPTLLHAGIRIIDDELMAPEL